MAMIHLYFGLLVLLAAASAIFWGPGRRLAQYALAVQVLLGIGLLLSHYRVTPLHWVLAILTGALWPLASALERRGRPRVIVVGLCVLALVVLAFVYHVGQASMEGRPVF